jgi:hypothetical protein
MRMQHWDRGLRALGLGTVVLSSILLLACGSDDITRSQASPAQAKPFAFDPARLSRNFDFIPDCNDCGSPWVPANQPTAPASIGVEMNGPMSHQLNQTCSFQALVNSTGATPPYTYQWSGAGDTGTGEFFYPNSTGETESYTVTLTVTDAAHNQGSVSRIVYVGDQYDPCPE